MTIVKVYAQFCSIGILVFIVNLAESALSYEYEESIEEKFSRFNLRSSDFAEIATTASFVDKTLFIKTFVEDHGIVVLTAPHHFGKSTNINMIKRFLEIEVDDDGNKKTSVTNIRQPIRDTENYELFVKLKIAENSSFMDHHFGKHPVIYVDFEFSNMHVMNYDVAVDQIKYIIHRSYVEHHYLKRSEKLNSEERNIVKNWCSTSGYIKISENDISDSLRLLSRFLYRHYENRRVYVLIDNFDSPVMNAILFALTENIMGGIYRLVSSVILNVLQKNFHAHRGLISGVSYIAGSPALYSLGYVSVCRFLENHTYVGLHGLTRDAAMELLSRDIFNLSANVIHQAEVNYGGYQSCSNITLFNMWSVIHVLLTKQVRCYWKDSGMASFKFDSLLRVPTLHTDLSLLSKGQERKVRLKKIYGPDDVIRLQDLMLKPELHKELPYTDLVLTFLLELGYLSYVPSHQSFLGRKRIKIPNKEMRKEICRKIKKYEEHYAVRPGTRYCG